MIKILGALLGLMSLSMAVAGQDVLLDEDHPLVGRIWDAANHRYVDKVALARQVVRADYVLLGETHDNPIHHRYQNWAVSQLLQSGRRLGVAFEMIDESQSTQVTGAAFDSADEFFDAVKWDDSGWPRRELYRELFETVIASRSPMYSANLSRARLRAIMTDAQPLGASVARLLKEAPLTEEQRLALREEIEESHCNMLPSQHVEGVMRGQRVRDAVMSLSVLTHRGDADVMVLIAGKGHTRSDRGVPGLIRVRDPKANIVSIAWHEVDNELTEPRDYEQYWGEEGLPFDYVWFTPRLQRPDPCEQLKHFKPQPGDNAESA